MKPEKLSIFQTSLALVAANVGGGILGLPYALHRMGMYFGFFMFFLLGFLCHWSNVMHMKVKDLTPRRNESTYEIAYLLFGRPSIFFVCLVMFFNNYGGIIMYYMVIGTTL